MMKIFMSYSSKNRSTVAGLAQDLKAQGYQVWFDREVPGGQSWWDMIVGQIRECDLFLFALTPSSLDSKPCKLEYGYAEKLGKNILPVLMEDGVSSNLLPPALSAIQYVDFRKQDKDAAFALLRALSNLPPPRPLPNPLPDPPAAPISTLGELRAQIESPTALTYEAQSALVLRLKEHANDPEQAADIRELCLRFKKRPDLYSAVEREIDATLGLAAMSAMGSEAGKKTAVPNRPPAPAQQPPPSVAFPEPPLRSAPVNPAPPRYNLNVATTPATGAWSQGILIALYVGTLFIPLIGIIAGGMGMRNAATKAQAQTLLIASVVWLVVAYILYSSLGVGRSYGY